MRLGFDLLGGFHTLVQIGCERCNHTVRELKCAPCGASLSERFMKTGAFSPGADPSAVKALLGQNTADLMRVLRETYGLGLREAKDAADRLLSK